ncbi:hypothetical protein ZIOFF_041835 [Zingiber officinale]|uniref:Uncharacterized protein n=1 Tax=Zingiber officinale TaxID=94328 RepID=A0A8J5G879_ZINOF|nr:hypothetical protein ZIOFF_041835 [Zingiber officinale]
MSGSAFNAFKARVPIAWSPRLSITLVRGLPGTRRLHLRRCHQIVIHRTTPSLLGMLNQLPSLSLLFDRLLDSRLSSHLYSLLNGQVKRLVAVETDEMYNARKQQEAEHRALRPPIFVSQRFSCGFLFCGRVS